MFNSLLTCIATASPNIDLPTFGRAATRSTHFLLNPPPIATSNLEKPLGMPAKSEGLSIRY